MKRRRRTRREKGKKRKIVKAIFKTLYKRRKVDVVAHSKAKWLKTNFELKILFNLSNILAKYFHLMHME